MDTVDGASKTPFTDLAQRILKNAEFLDNYLAKNNLPAPSFEEDSPLYHPSAPDFDLAKITLQDDLLDLELLAAGPSGLFSLINIPAYHDLGVLKNMNQFNFWDAVPLGGTATYEEISSKVGLSPKLVKRFLRLSMSKRIFAETGPNSGVIKHTASTALLVKVPEWRAMIGHCLEEVAPSALYVGETLKKVGESEEPMLSAIAQLNFPDKPEYKNCFGWVENDGEGDQKGWRSKRFSKAMQVLANDPTLRIDLIHQLYDWDALGDATIVDIGGSRGHISFEILKKHPKLKAVVQDLPGLEGEWSPPVDLASRASFQVHNFFEPETIKGAEVYFLKHILHDWSDKYASQILSNIVPVMAANSKILIMEFVIPPAGVAPNTAMRMLAAMDMQMLVACQSLERAPEDWVELVKKASPKLKVNKIHSLHGSASSIIEVVLA